MACGRRKIENAALNWYTRPYEICLYVCILATSQSYYVGFQCCCCVVQHLCTYAIICCCFTKTHPPESGTHTDGPGGHNTKCLVLLLYFTKVVRVSSAGTSAEPPHFSPPRRKATHLAQRACGPLATCVSWLCDCCSWSLAMVPLNLTASRRRTSPCVGFTTPRRRMGLRLCVGSNTRL